MNKLYLKGFIGHSLKKSTVFVPLLVYLDYYSLVLDINEDGEHSLWDNGDKYKEVLVDWRSGIKYEKISV